MYSPLILRRVRVDSLYAASVHLWLLFDLSKRRRSKKKDFFLGKSSMYLSRNPAPHLPSSTSVRSHSQSSCSSTLLGGQKSSQIFLSLRSVIIWNLPSSFFRATRPRRRRSRKPSCTHTTQSCSSLVLVQVVKRGRPACDIRNSRKEFWKRYNAVRFVRTYLHIYVLFYQSASKYLRSVRARGRTT